MKIERFEDIEAWKESRLLVQEVYELFKDCRDFGFRDQFQRAAISVMSNIAEGFDRGSNKEFIQFLNFSRGSLAEVKSLSYSALDIGFVDEYQFKSLLEKCNKIKRIISGFIKYLKLPRTDV